MSKVGITSVKVNGVRINGIGSPLHSSPSKPSLPPHIKDALVGVWCTEGKSNDDSDRDIIKNKISGRGGDLLCRNFAWGDRSGYGGGDGIRSSIIITESGKTAFKDVKYRGFTLVKGKTISNGTNYIHSTIYNNTFNFNIKISGLSETDNLYIHQYSRPDALKIKLHNGLNRIYVPITDLSYPYTTLSTDTILSNDVTVEFLHLYPGAFVTDGVNDLIVSQKTSSEMLEGSDEITVVSMILNLDINKTARTNFIAGMGINSDIWINNETKSYNKTGIYGYSRTNSNIKIINNILGDKSDYSTSTSIDSVVNKEFSVIGYRSTSEIVGSASPSAYYWTMMFKSASITIDDIHQVIAHFNLDKRVVPTIYYDIKKQGLSNDTPDKDWYLKDFSGNGRDAKLYNFAKKLNSGVGLYAADFNDWSHYGNVTSSSKLAVRPNYPGAWVAYKDNYYHDAYKVEINGLDDGKKVPYRYYDEGGVMSSVNLYNGENIIPKSFGSNRIGFGAIPGNSKEVTIEHIPEHDGALVLDGVIDYAQYVGDLGLKDYTIAVDRAYGVFNQYQIPIIASKFKNGSESFIFEHSSDLNQINSYSFGAVTIVKREYALTRKVSYQTAYAYNGVSINKGISTLTGSGLTIGRYGEDYNYAAIRLYSLLLFPYSLSEFLLDRQLKRYKLGTLYPETK